MMTLADQETEGMHVISFPKSATIGDVEKEIDDFYSIIDTESPSLVFDLSDCTYVEIAVWQLITSHLVRRYRLGLETKIRIPGGPSGLRARHALRRWKYAEVFPVVFRGEKYFQDFVDRSDLKYFRGSAAGGDRGDPYSGATVEYEDGAGRVTFRVAAYRFFAFKTWRISERTDKRSFVEEEIEDWSRADPEIIETLSRRLGSKASSDTSKSRFAMNQSKFVQGRIVIQAITNALRHPRASILQASSHLESNNNFFTLVYWDDGESMHRTLSKAIEQDLSIQHMTRYNVNYLVKLEDGPSIAKPRILSSTMIPSRGSSEDEFLVSTIFPGVTCDVEDREGISRLGWDDQSELAVPGHGLFFLVDAAISVFGGSVAFRTGNWFMNVSAPTAKDLREVEITGPYPRYKIKISRRKADFLGNMVTVRLPLDKGHQ